MTTVLPKLPDYTVLEVLRDTSLGSSWLLMHQETLSRSVLKRIPLDYIGKEECLWLASAQHPRLPKTLGAWFDGDFFWHYAFVEGTDLNQYISDRGPLAEDALRQVATQILDILSYLHRQSPPIVFRDLKPSNLIITTEGEVVLIDLASIRFVKPEEATPSPLGPSGSDTVVLGTVGYAAPEAYGFFKTDERSDIFSFGATLYYLGTGNQLNQRQKNQHRVSQALQEIIGKCTSFDPEFRYQSVDALLPQLLPMRITTHELTHTVDPFRPVIPLTDGLEALLTQPILGITVETSSGPFALNFHIDHTPEGQGSLRLANPIFPMNRLPLEARITLLLDLGDNAFIKLSFVTGGIEAIRFDGSRQRIYIPEMPEAGFNYPYFLFVPPNITAPCQLAPHLFVTPPLCYYNGNSDRHQTIDSAHQAMAADIYQEFHDASGCLRLYPALPRYRILVDGKWAYTSFFDSTVLSLSSNSSIVNLDQDHPITEAQLLASQRLDLQVVAMLTHARDYLKTQGILLNDRHIFFGGGSPGHFAYRMSLLHPEVVLSLVALAINGHVTLPSAQYSGVSLPFPIGLEGLAAWGVSMTTEKLEGFRALPKFIYMPNVDNNDVLYEEQCYTEPQRQAVILALGERMLPDRWQRTIEALEHLGVRALCVTGTMPLRGFTAQQLEMIKEFIALSLKDPNTVESQLQRALDVGQLTLEQTKLNWIP